MTHAMKAVRFAVLLPAMAMSKCPVTSDTPIAEASSEAFDPHIPGTWRCMSQDDDSVAVLRLESRTPTVLTMFYEEKGKVDSVTFQSGKLAGKKVANMGASSGDGDKREWSVARLRLLQENVLLMDLLVGDVPDSLSAAAKKKAIDRLAKANSFEEGFLCSMKRPS